MNRRTFLKAGAATAGAAAIIGPARTLSASGTAPSDGQVVTVTGPVDPSELGRTLPHEHVMVDFAGADEVSRDRYDRSEVEDVVTPYLEELADVGGHTLIECTPAFLGRAPSLLHRLSTATGIQLVTNTGYYGANDDHNVPEHAYADSVDTLAARWIAEWENGIGDTDIRPGFIKIGVDPGPLSSIDEKLVRAAARTHLETGLTIASHTGPAEPAFEQLAVLEEEGVAPEAWIWVHAQNEDDHSRHIDAATRGAWVELDAYGPEETDEYVDLLTLLREHDLLDRVLVSQDRGWYSVGESNGGDFRPYTSLFTDLVPALRTNGFSANTLEQLLIQNPATAFKIGAHSR